MKERLSKVLARSGVAARRKCEEIIFAGRVKINGKIIKTPQTMVDPRKAAILLDNKPIRFEEKKVYFLLNKPIGYLCSNEESSKKKVLSLFSDLPYRLFTVGRLDKDTSGLILVTNDGPFAQRVIHPSFNCDKEYLVKVKEEVTHLHLFAISNGVRIDGNLCRPVKVTKVRRGTLKIVIREGKKHEIKKLIEQAELSILELKRIRLGPLTLGNIPVGYYRPLSKKEVQFFQKPL